MKKIMIILLFCSIFFVSFAPCVFAGEQKSESTIDDSAIPQEIRKYLPEEIFDCSSEEFLEIFTVNTTLKTVLSIAGNIFPEVMSAFILLVGLCVISAVLSALKESAGVQNLRYALEFISVLCVSTAAFYYVQALFEDFSLFMEQVTAFMRIIVPAMSALMLSSGEISASMVFGSVLAAIVAFLENFSAVVFVPLLSALMCISVTSSACSDVDISGFSRLIKNIVTYILSAVMLILTCVMAFQTVIAKSADTAVVKGVKFVIGNAVPIVGGALADAITTVASSVGLVRAGTGIGGAIVVCVMFALPVIKMILWKLMLDAVGAISSAFSLQKESAFFFEISQITGFLIAVMASMAMLFIIALAAAAFSGGGAVK